MKNIKLYHIILGFATINSLISLSRLYLYFFTGHDITPITDPDVKFTITMGMAIISVIGYFIGFMIKTFQD